MGPRERLATPSVSYSQADFRQLQTPHPMGPQLATSSPTPSQLAETFCNSSNSREFFSLPPWRAPEVCGRLGKYHEGRSAGNLKESSLPGLPASLVEGSLLPSPIHTAQPKHHSLYTLCTVHHELGPKSLPLRLSPPGPLPLSP